jgi:hypothetical protein
LTDEVRVDGKDDVIEEQLFAVSAFQDRAATGTRNTRLFAIG